jgi:DMSO/TMAO reductase YedYZ molybdopterin-dependent catalytic subunit
MVRRFKRSLLVPGSILLVMLATLILASCQPVSEELQPDTNVVTATEPVLPVEENYTPPPGTNIAAKPEPTPAVEKEYVPPPETNATAAAEPVSPAVPNYTSRLDANITITPEPVLPVAPESNVGLTPIDKLGVTGQTQDVDISEYRLTISGLVEKPLSLAYQDILEYPSVTEIVVVECPGFFRDTAEWTGVPLSAILTEAGLISGASWVTFTAVDGYRQKLSLEHVNEYGVFLAYKVNGQTLPPAHGYPLRVVDKGSIGSKWVKWLESIKIE